MSQLTVTALQLGLLVALWVFVAAVVVVLRRDLYGTRVLSRPRSAGGPGPGHAAPPAAAVGSGRGATSQPAAAAPPRRLVVTEGPLRGTALDLGRAPVLIGRSPECSLVLDDDYASSRHARLSPTGSPPGATWRLEDLGSTNGTLLARAPRAPSEPLEGSSPVGAGAVVRIGRTTIELQG